MSVIISQMELKFVNASYFKQLFQNLRPKLQFSKHRIFVTSHFGTLLGSEPPRGGGGKLLLGLKVKGAS